MLPLEYYDLEEELLDLRRGYTLMLDDPREAFWYRMLYRPHARHIQWQMDRLKTAENIHPDEESQFGHSPTSSI